LVICVVPDTIFAGSPTESTSTTKSTLLPWICHGMQGNGTRLSVTTMTCSAYIESTSAKPSEPQADGPCDPSQFPKGSAVGAAITAMSILTSPSCTACQRPPCERRTPSPRILPRDVYSPSGPFMLPSMWCTTPRSIRSITGSWQGNEALGNHIRSFTPISAAVCRAMRATLSPLRK
jgi:hypothetical protein